MWCHLARPPEQSTEDADDDTPASRLVTSLVKYMLKAFPAKNKNVRLRSCQLIAILINGLPDLESVCFLVADRSDFSLCIL
jgi:condensin complex subunit 3